jgi:hypothetical protein
VTVGQQIDALLATTNWLHVNIETLLGEKTLVVIVQAKEPAPVAIPVEPVKEAGEAKEMVAP